MILVTNFIFIYTIAIELPPPTTGRGFVELSTITRVCDQAGYGTSREPDLLQTLTVHARNILISLFVGEVAITIPAYSKTMYNCYMTYAEDHGLKKLTSFEFKGFIEELLSVNLIGGVHFHFGSIRTKNYETVRFRINI